MPLGQENILILVLPANFALAMDIQQILRWIVGAIILMIAIIIMGGILKVASFMLGFAIKGLLVLLVIAIILRLISLISERR